MIQYKAPIRSRLVNNTEHAIGLYLNGLPYSVNAGGTLDLPCDAFSECKDETEQYTLMYLVASRELTVQVLAIRIDGTYQVTDCYEAHQQGYVERDTVEGVLDAVQEVEEALKPEKLVEDPVEEPKEAPEEVFVEASVEEPKEAPEEVFVEDPVEEPKEAPKKGRKGFKKEAK